MAPTVYPIVGTGFSIYENPSLGHSENSWAPRPYNSWVLLNSLNHLPRVKDLFDVKQGVRAGYKKAFLLQKAEWLSLPANERKFFRPAVVNDSIHQGYLSDIAYIFYPYGDLTIRTEQELSQSVSEYYLNRLLPCKEELRARKGIHQNAWWELTRHRDWQVNPISKLVSTYFGDSGSFAWDADGRYVVWQGLAWLPRGGKVLSSRISLVYVAILNSRFFSELLSATSNNVGGGQWNLSTKFVDMIAMPELTDSDIGSSSAIATLYEIGEQIHCGKMDKIDKELYTETVKEAYSVNFQ
jgi:hypothetical protein